MANPFPDLEPLSFPFGKNQDVYLPFLTREGFAAVRLDLIEGFAANSDGTSAVIIVDNAGSYNSLEPVPVLLKRDTTLRARRGEERRVGTDGREAGPQNPGETASQSAEDVKVSGNVFSRPGDDGKVLREPGTDLDDPGRPIPLDTDSSFPGIKGRLDEAEEKGVQSGQEQKGEISNGALKAPFPPSGFRLTLPPKG